METRNLMELAALTIITEVGARLLLESHNFDGYSMFSREGDIYAVLVAGEGEDGAIEFAAVKSLSPFTLEGVTGSTTNLMSKVLSGEIEILGRLTGVIEGSIKDISSLRARQLRGDDSCGDCKHTNEAWPDLVN
jgi:hypothetical protein